MRVFRGGRTISAIPVPASYSVDLARGSAGPWSVMKTTQVDSSSPVSSSVSSSRPTAASATEIDP